MKNLLASIKGQVADFLILGGVVRGDRVVTLRFLRLRLKDGVFIGRGMLFLH